MTMIDDVLVWFVEAFGGRIGKLNYDGIKLRVSSMIDDGDIEIQCSLENDTSLHILVTRMSGTHQGCNEKSVDIGKPGTCPVEWMKDMANKV